MLLSTTAHLVGKAYSPMKEKQCLGHLLSNRITIRALAVMIKVKDMHEAPVANTDLAAATSTVQPANNRAQLLVSKGAPLLTEIQ